MPTIQVELNGQTLAEVELVGLDLLTVQLSGDRISDGFASLDMHGGTYPDGAASTFLFWLADVPVDCGDELKVMFNPAGTSSHCGKTIDELYPGEPDHPDILADAREHLLDLRGSPYLRKGYRFKLNLPGQQQFVADSDPTDHGFGFSALWNWRHPERVSVSLHTYALDDLIERRPTRDIARHRLVAGETVVLQVGLIG